MRVDNDRLQNTKIPVRGLKRNDDHRQQQQPKELQNTKIPVRGLKHNDCFGWAAGVRAASKHQNPREGIKT